MACDRNLINKLSYNTESFDETFFISNNYFNHLTILAEHDMNPSVSTKKELKKGNWNKKKMRQME